MKKKKVKYVLGRVPLTGKTGGSHRSKKSYSRLIEKRHMKKKEEWIYL